MIFDFFLKIPGIVIGYVIVGGSKLYQMTYLSQQGPAWVLKIFEENQMELRFLFSLRKIITIHIMNRIPTKKSLCRLKVILQLIQSMKLSGLAFLLDTQ